MKELTKNSLGYGALLTGATLLGSSILVGNFSRSLPANSPNTEQADALKTQASLFNYAKKLETSDNPRDLAVSAFLQLSNTPRVDLEHPAEPSNENMALLKKALALGQEDPTLAWLEAMDCGPLKAACNKGAALTRLRRLEPDNAAVDFLYLNEADSSGNTEAAWQAIASGGQKKYFKLPIDAIGAMYYQSLQNWNSPITMNPKEVFGKNAKDIRPINQEEYRKITAFGYSIAIAIPALQPYSKYCKPAPIDANHLKACKQFTEKFAAGDNLLSQSMGTRFGTALFLQSPDKELWQARRNQFQWQQMKYHELIKSDYSVERRHFEAWPEKNELERITALLNENGIPLSPPAGWFFQEKM